MRILCNILSLIVPIVILFLFLSSIGPIKEPSIIQILLIAVLGVIGCLAALLAPIILIEEQTIFRLMENFFLGFKLRKKNNIKGGAGRWTNQQINSRLGNKSFSFNVGNDHTLVRLPFRKMALISNEQQVVGTGYVERFEPGRSIKDEDGNLVILYEAGPVLAGDGWAAKEFRILVCEAGNLKDLPLETISYRDRSPQIFSNDRGEIGILQYGVFPYRKQFPQIKRVLNLKDLNLVESK
tara:strand:+ start:186 stop:902 length:717 start_codon:yes stop_codon:yes gene_type:complete